MSKSVESYDHAPLIAITSASMLLLWKALHTFIHLASPSAWWLHQAAQLDTAVLSAIDDERITIRVPLAEWMDLEGATMKAKQTKYLQLDMTVVAI